MATIARIIAFGAASIWLTLGCAASFEWAGQWRGTRPYTIAPGEDPGIAGTAATVRLTLRNDGTYDLEDGGIPTSGEFETHGLQATLKPVRVAGAPISRAGPEFGRTSLLAVREGHLMYRSSSDSAQELELKRLDGDQPR